MKIKETVGQRAVAQLQKAGAHYAAGLGLDTQYREKRERRNGGRVKRRVKP